MKRLINLLLGLTLTAVPLFSQDFLPEEFRNYKEKGKELFSNKIPIINAGNFMYKTKLIDINNDNIEDVVEFYMIIDISQEGIKTLNNPSYYYFDLNHNGVAEDYEWILDPKIDGLNGNEEMYIKPKQIRISSKKEIKL